MPDVVASTVARRKPPQRHARAVPISRSSSGDRVLAGLGIMIAMSSLAFAGYMVSDVDRPPRIAGLEYLSIFARPSHSGAAALDRPLAIEAAPAPSIAAGSIDLTPTGSIPDKGDDSRPIRFMPPPVRANDLPPPISTNKLLDVLNGEALVQTDVGLRHVKAGDLLPDLGRINSIEKKGDHWVLLTQSGATLEWPPQSSLPNNAAAADKKNPPR
jgi:hypothetical protein